MYHFFKNRKGIAMEMAIGLMLLFVALGAVLFAVSMNVILNSKITETSLNEKLELDVIGYSFINGTLSADEYAEKYDFEFSQGGNGMLVKEKDTGKELLTVIKRLDSDGVTYVPVCWLYDKAYQAETDIIYVYEQSQFVEPVLLKGDTVTYVFMADIDMTASDVTDARFLVPVNIDLNGHTLKLNTLTVSHHGTANTYIRNGFIDCSQFDVSAPNGEVFQERGATVRGNVVNIATSGYTLSGAMQITENGLLSVSGVFLRASDSVFTFNNGSQLRMSAGSVITDGANALLAVSNDGTAVSGTVTELECDGELPTPQGLIEGTTLQSLDPLAVNAVSDWFNAVHILSSADGDIETAAAQFDGAYVILADGTALGINSLTRNSFNAAVLDARSRKCDTLLLDIIGDTCTLKYFDVATLDVNAANDILLYGTSVTSNAVFSATASELTVVVSNGSDVNKINGKNTYTSGVVTLNIEAGSSVGTVVSDSAYTLALNNGGNVASLQHGGSGTVQIVNAANAVLTEISFTSGGVLQISDNSGTVSSVVQTGSGQLSFVNNGLIGEVQYPAAASGAAWTNNGTLTSVIANGEVAAFNNYGTVESIIAHSTFYLLNGIDAETAECGKVGYFAHSGQTDLSVLNFGDITELYYGYYVSGANAAASGAFNLVNGATQTSDMTVRTSFVGTAYINTVGTASVQNSGKLDAVTFENGDCTLTNSESYQASALSTEFSDDSMGTVGKVTVSATATLDLYNNIIYTCDGVNVTNGGALTVVYNSGTLYINNAETHTACNITENVGSIVYVDENGNEINAENG